MQIPGFVAEVLKLAAPTLLTALGLPPPLSVWAAKAAGAALEAWLPGSPAPLPDQAAPAPPPAVAAPTPEAIVTAVEAHAGEREFILALRRADDDVKRLEDELGLKFAEIAEKSRQRASDFQRDTGTAPALMRWGFWIVAACLSLVFGSVVGTLLVLSGALRVSYENAGFASAVFGVIGSALAFFSSLATQIISFYYGSSSGSKEKSADFAAAFDKLGTKLGEAATSRPPPLPPPPAPPVVVVPPAPVPAPPGSGVPAVSRFHAWIELLLQHEGGYVDHPRDPGGCTNRGITLGTLRDWRGEPVTCDDVRDLSEEEAREIYFAKYWNALSCDALPRGVDWCVFDFGVNAGVSRAARTLQATLARRDPTLKVDGVIGPLSIAAAAKAPAAALISEFHDARMAHYRSLGTWDVFGAGWTRRADAVRAQALADAAKG